MNYTQLTVLALILVLITDQYWLKTKILLTRRFGWFLLAVVILQTIVDNYLNGRWLANNPIVGPYNPEFFSGIKIWHTPLENYGFGIALISLNVIIFEFLERRSVRRQSSR